MNTSLSYCHWLSFKSWLSVGSFHQRMTACWLLMTDRWLRNSVKLMSSTYLWVTSTALSPLMMMMNISGPRYDPWDIPAVIGSHPDITSSILTRWCLPWRNDHIHRTTLTTIQSPRCRSTCTLSNSYPANLYTIPTCTRAKNELPSQIWWYRPIHHSEQSRVAQATKVLAR